MTPASRGSKPTQDASSPVTVSLVVSSPSYVTAGARAVAEREIGGGSPAGRAGPAQTHRRVAPATPRGVGTETGGGRWDESVENDNAHDLLEFIVSKQYGVAR